MMEYFIKKNYRTNLDVIPYIDTLPRSSTYQYEIYKFARKIIKKHDLKNILDIGCGIGTKLYEIIYPVCEDIIGIDSSSDFINICKQEYSFGQWFIDDIEDKKIKLDRKFDIIISSDVIEHLVNPDNLLSYIRKFSNNDTFIIISTPERDLVRGIMSNGPPANKSHVREWNKMEFNKYIKSRGFDIIDHFVTFPKKKLSKTIMRTRPLEASRARTSQVILCKLSPVSSTPCPRRKLLLI